MPDDPKRETLPLPFSRARTIWRLRCPACGHGNLLRGVLKPVDHCSICGHDFTGYSAADGPAYIAICMVGTLVTGLAAWVELKFEPAYWLHAVLWLPMIMILSLVCLRYSKGWFAAAHYQHQILEPKNIAEVRRNYQGSEHRHD